MTDPRATAAPDPARPDATERRTAHEAKAEWEVRLAEIWREWADGLPAEAAVTWKKGAAYVRHSSARSLAGEAPDAQLRHVLTLLAAKQVYVPENGVFFDVQSATDVVGRAAFALLFEQALANHFKVVGCFVNERLFRNLEQSIQYKRKFRLHGIELEYLGRFEGDQRNPAAWQLETMQDMNAEYHARNTGYYVGTHIETLTRAGHVVGVQPEVFVQAERAPAFMGRRGSVTRWDVQQPLASIMQEGCRRYLAGSSFAELGEWAKSTELGGFTPAGRQMDKRWWYYSLKNPKLAGYQMPTTYTGFKPGRESPPRPRRNAESELVPCLLPPLWSKETYYEILALARKRSLGNKQRKKYRDYLLSGIAYGECGCNLWVCDTFAPPVYRMRCGSLEEGDHVTSFRVDVADRELDELIGGITFNNAELIAAVEAELAAMVADERRAAEVFVPDPRIAQLRQALAALAGIDAAVVRDDLARRLQEYEALDEARRASAYEPVVKYREAIAHLRNWSKVWAKADTKTKNDLLANAGVRVEIKRSGTERGALGHITKVSARNESFGMALAAVVSAANPALGLEQSSSRPYVGIAVGLSGRASALQARDGLVMVPRPVAQETYTLREFCRLSGRGRQTIRRWLHAGLIRGSCTDERYRMPGWAIPVEELDKCLAAEEAEKKPRDPRLMTLTAFAAAAHAHRATVRTWIERGQVRGVRSVVGGTIRWHIPREELDSVWGARVPSESSPSRTGEKLGLVAFAQRAHASPWLVHRWLESGVIDGEARTHGTKTRWLISDAQLDRLPVARTLRRVA